MNEKEIDWELAANHWIEKEPEEARMLEGDLLAEIEGFLACHKVCALATAGAHIVRNTPVEYVYAEGAFWVFSEGGLKFKALHACSDVCLAVFDENPSFGSLAGLQITGAADVLAPFGEEYVHACNLRKLPVEQLEKLPFTMNIIKITPKRYDYLDSKLKERGFSSRQHVQIG